METCSDWCVGSEFDEECNEMCYAMWFVRFRESRDHWTHIVHPGHPECVYVSVPSIQDCAAWCYRVPHVPIDPIDIRRVHFNLCMNYIDHTYVHWRKCTFSVCGVCIIWVVMSMLIVINVFDILPLCAWIIMEYPPNLSILISGGEDTILNTVSHCEWMRFTSQLELLLYSMKCCIECTANVWVGLFDL